MKKFVLGLLVSLFSVNAFASSEVSLIDCSNEEFSVIAATQDGKIKDVILKMYNETVVSSKLESYFGTYNTIDNSFGFYGIVVFTNDKAALTTFHSTENYPLTHVKLECK